MEAQKHKLPCSKSQSELEVRTQGFLFPKPVLFPGAQEGGRQGGHAKDCQPERGRIGCRQAEGGQEWDKDDVCRGGQSRLKGDRQKHPQRRPSGMEGR